MLSVVSCGSAVWEWEKYLLLQYLNMVPSMGGRTPTKMSL